MSPLRKWARRVAHVLSLARWWGNHFSVRVSRDQSEVCAGICIPGLVVSRRPPTVSPSLSEKMNGVMKNALKNTNINCMNLRAALFHSTPVLERKRRNHWESRFYNFNKRTRRMHAKQTVLRNINAYADYLFQGWQFDNDRDDPYSTEGPSWFRIQDWSKGSKGRFNANWGPQQRGRRGFHFCEDDFEVETIFQSAFGGDRFFYWSFINEENPQWRNSSGNSNYGRTWSSRYRVEEDYDDASTEDETSEPDLASDRRALGLKACGPLRLKDVKTAYRACALKWHPDRHQGKTKAIAEEKFKLCSAAYQSLCDRLSVA